MLDIESTKREILESYLFDAEWYLARYTDVAAVGLEPIDHFVRFGLSMGRSPGPRFDARFYLKENVDVAQSGFPALLHFIRYGQSEGRAAKAPAFSEGTGAISGIAALQTVSPLGPSGERSWKWRLATDAFMLRGLEPLSSLAVVVNASSEEHWYLALESVEQIASPEGLDLFLLGSSNFDFAHIPQNVRSISHLGSADELGNARGFLQFATSGAPDSYKALLWLSPQDQLPNEDLKHIAKAGGELVSDSRRNWGCVGAGISDVSTVGGDSLLATMRIAMPRIGLGAVPEQNVAVGGAIWVRPLLLRALVPTIRPSEITSVNDGKTFPGRSTVLAVLSFVANEADMDVHQLATEAGGTKKNVTVPATAQTRELKAVAFYLPQFHPIPENDKWWGKGFTEWSNVVRGKQLFRHHYQPRLPADLGYYDLRLEETLIAQASMAREFGIHGFCYYYYWFNGKKLLNQPIEQMARSSRADAAFCVCWANENWSRNWDGQNRHVLLKQEYSLESNVALMRELIPMMKDPRWIRYNGRPVMLVYRISIIPNWRETARLWREECRKAGLGEIHLCAVRFGLENLQGQPEEHGLDSYVLFPPHEAARSDLRDQVHDLHKDFGGEIFDYKAVVDGDIEKYSAGYEWPVHRGTMLAWDNTARRLTDARVFHGATPYGFRRWMKKLLEQEMAFNNGSESLVFINAWNEWAEGTYLEPDQRWGRSNLAAFRSAVDATDGMETSVVGLSAAAAPKFPELLKKVGVPLNSEGQLPSFPRWYPGKRARIPDQPTVMLTAHVSGHHLFGGERSFLDVLEAFSKMPINVLVTLPSDNNKKYIEQICSKSLGVYSLYYPQWRDNRSAYNWLTTTFADIIAKHSVDVVHVNTIVLLEPALAARRMGRTSVIHSRELISLDQPLQKEIALDAGEIVAEVLRRSDWVIGNSRVTCKLFSKGDQTIYVPNCIHPSEFDMQNRFGSTIKFGIVSSNIPKKGIEDFVEVARLSADRAPLAKFVVIGPETDKTREWAQEVASGKRPNNLEFLGYRDTPRSAVSEFNVLLNLSSFAESFGRTVAEAMAARRPVVAYDWGALPELVQNGVNGFLVPYKNIERVVDAVQALCENSNLIAKMGEAGRAFVKDNFSQDNLSLALAEAYEKILGKSMKSPKLKSRTSPAKMSANAKTSIIVPVYNAPDEVLNCLNSIAKHTDLETNELIVINDSSPDPRVEEVISEYKGIKNVTILSNVTNMGYTKTINRGLLEAGSSDVVLLNSDTVVTPRWLEGLRAAAYSGEKIGTATAMSDNAGAFSFPTFNEYCPKPPHLSNEEYALLLTQATQDCVAPEVPTGSGFCMYIRRSLIEECGLFDHEAFPRGYGEENDFCMRAGAAGWKHVVSPSSFVYHVRTASFKGEKNALVQAGVNVVTRRFPDYAKLVRSSFASPEMLALREAASNALKC